MSRLRISWIAESWFYLTSSFGLAMFSKTRQFDVENKSVIVAGGSKGLGRELSLELVRRGAHVTSIGRDERALAHTRQLMQSSTLCADQLVETMSLDLVNSDQVRKYIDSLEEAPRALFCVAGGTSDEIGFFADISADSISNCMAKNYFSAAFIANVMMKRWIADAKALGDDYAGPRPKHHLIFTASTAALVAVPGYAAYAPTKAAIRALADILRMESLMYRSVVEINVHCSFPGTIYTDSFYKEQEKKPALCKEIEGTTQDGGGQSAEAIARGILSGLNANKYFITTDLLTTCLLANMRGSSPSSAAIFDSILGLGWRLVWPLVRRRLDYMTITFGRRSPG